MILTDKRAYTPPTCPRCGTLTTVDWIEIQFRGPAQGGWMPGQIECPNGHIPAPGETWPDGTVNDPAAVVRDKTGPADG